MFLPARDKERASQRTIHVAYGGFAVLATIALLTRTPSWSPDNAMDHWLTSACACQAFALFVLCAHLMICREVAGSISLKMAYLFVACYASKCYSVFFYSGYTPEDSLGSQYIYHFIEAFGLVVSCALCYILKYQCDCYLDKEKDTMIIWPILVVCAVAAFLTQSNANDSIIGDFAWMFAQWLETGAIVPEIWLAARKGGLERASSHFIALLIFNRLLLSIFWSWVQYQDWVNNRELGNYFMWGIWGSNVSHLLLCGDFMYYYFKSLNSSTFSIPI